MWSPLGNARTRDGLHRKTFAFVLVTWAVTKSKKLSPFVANDLAQIPLQVHDPFKRALDPSWEETMALVHHEPDRTHDWHLCGLFLVIIGAIALSVPVVKMAVDQFFSLIW